MMKWNLLLWWYPGVWRLRNVKVEIPSSQLKLCLKPCCHRCQMPNQEKLPRFAKYQPVQKPEERNWWTLLYHFHPCVLELYGNRVIEVDSRRGSLWLCNVLWGYLLAADFPGWKDVEQYLLNYCQILFMRPNCIIVPGNRPRSCKDHHPRHICSNPEVSCSLQMGQRLVMVWDSASKIAVKVTNWARTHDLWRCSSWQPGWCCVAVCDCVIAVPAAPSLFGHF